MQEALKDLEEESLKKAEIKRKEQESKKNRKGVST
jgi:hypothetical protein